MSSFKKKTKPKETLSQQISNYCISMVAGLYVFIMLCVFPLYFQDKYFNMGDAKFAFFMYATLIGLGMLILCFIPWLIAHHKETNYDKVFCSFSKTDWFVVAYFFASFLSFCLSEYRIGDALNGYAGWNMGILSQMAFILIYLFVSRFWKWSPATLELATVTGAITYLLGVLQRFSIDPLEMYKNLSPADIEKFLSTLGQTSWFSSYVVLIFPVGVFYFWNDKKLVSRIWSGIFTALGFASLCTTNSDSAYVAFGLTLLVFLWFSLESNERFIRWLEVVLLGLATFRMIGVLQKLFPERQVTLLTGTEALTSFVNHSTFMLIMLIVVALFYGWFRWAVKDTGKSKSVTIDISKLIWIRKAILIGAGLCVAGVVLLIVLTTNHQLPQFLNKIDSIGFFHFVDSWGNHRGFNWRMAITAFSHSSIKDLWFGVGPDCFAGSMSKYCAEEVAAYWHGQTLACAHNEWLNMLITEGVLGVVAYIGIFVSCIIRAGKMAGKETAAIPFVAATLAYMGHNFFCYQTCVCTPIIFIMMGIAEMICRNAQKEKKEGL